MVELYHVDNIPKYDGLWQRPVDLRLTGEGCIVGVIDQPSWLGNPAYSANIKSVFQAGDEICANEFDAKAPMHGAAVLSVIVGGIGVAPAASVIFNAIRTSTGRPALLENHAKALRRLQKYLAEGGRLDAISTSHGWQPSEQGAAENDRLSDWFDERNVPIFSANDTLLYPCGPRGLAAAWRELSVRPERHHSQIAIPVDERLIACRNRQEINSYGNLYYRIKQGGISWGVPFIAGMFLLGRQALPAITRHEFQQILLRTARIARFPDKSELPVPDMSAFGETLELVARSKTASRKPRSPHL